MRTFTRYAIMIVALMLSVGAIAGSAGAESQAITDNGLFFGLDQATAFIAGTTDDPAGEEATITFSLTFGINEVPVPSGDLTAMSFEFTYDPARVYFVEPVALGGWTVDTTLIESGRIKVDLYGNAVQPPQDNPTAFAQLVFRLECQEENHDNFITFDRLRSTATVGTLPYQPPSDVQDNWHDGTVTVADYTASFQIGSLEKAAGYDQEITIPVTATTNFRMMALSQQITYDDARLEFLGVELDGVAWANYMDPPGAPLPGANPIQIPLVADINTGVPVLDNEVIYSLRFRTKTDPEWDGQSTAIEFDTANCDVWAFAGSAHACEQALSDFPPVEYDSGTVTLERYTAEFKAVPIADNIYVGGDYLVSYVLQMKNRFYTGMPENDEPYKGNITCALDFGDVATDFQKVEFDDSLHFRMNSDEKSLGTMVSLYQDWDAAKPNFWGIQDQLKDAVQIDFTYTGALPTSYSNRFVTPFTIVSENPFSTYGGTSRVTDLYGNVEADSLSGRLTWEVEPLEIEMGEWYGTGGWSKFGSVVTGTVKMRHNVDLSNYHIEVMTGPEYYITGVVLGNGVMYEPVQCAPNMSCRIFVPGPTADLSATGTNWRTIATITYKPRSGCTPGTRVVGSVIFTDRYMTDTQGHMIHTVGNNSASLSALCPDDIVIPIDSVPDIPFDRKPDPGLPDAFALHANYPNPFNPTTRIQFDLPSACHVTLDVFNIAGQRVATLVDRTYEAGFHTVEWNGRTSQGQPVASGIYLYRMTAGSFVETKKMMLLK